MVSHSKLFPEAPKAAVPAAHHSVQLQELHFHRLCVWGVRFCQHQNTAAALCFPLTCQKFHKELKDTQGLTLMVLLLTIGWCVKSEWPLHGPSPWVRLGEGWVLEPGCRGADRCRHKSQGPVCCFQLLVNMWFINSKFLHIAVGKGRAYFPQWVWCVEKFSQALSCEENKICVQLLDCCFCCTLNKLLGAGAWGTKGCMGISRKFFHHTIGFYCRFFLILNQSLLLQPEQWSSQCC